MSGAQPDNCPNCLHPLECSMDNIMVLPCNHKIHTECYYDYLDASRVHPDMLKCPVCRKTPHGLRMQERELIRPDRAVAAPVLQEVPAPEIVDPSDVDTSPDDNADALIIHSPADTEPGLDPADVPDVSAVDIDETQPSPIPAGVPDESAQPRSTLTPATQPGQQSLLNMFRARSRPAPASPIGVVDAAEVAAEFETFIDTSIAAAVTDALVEAPPAEVTAGTVADSDDDRVCTALASRPRVGTDSDDDALTTSHPNAKGKKGKAKGKAEGKGKRKGKDKASGANGTNGDVEPAQTVGTSGAKGEGKTANLDAAKGKGKRAAADPAATDKGKGKRQRTMEPSVAEAPPPDAAKGKGKRAAEDPAATGKGNGKRQRTMEPSDAEAPPAKGNGKRQATVETSGAADGAPPSQRVRTDVPQDATVPPHMAPPKADFVRSVVAVPLEPSPTALCNWCGSMLALSKLRVTSKSQIKYKCDRCNATFAKMNSEVGSWPTEEFKALTDDQQREFYAKARELRSTSAIMEIQKNMLESYKVQETTWEMGGQFLPLAVWVQNGWNGPRIENNTDPEDVIWTNQGGWCYRVKIMATAERGSSGTKRSTLLSLQDKPPALPVSASAADPAIESRSDYQARIKRERDVRKELDKTENSKRQVATQLAKKLSAPLGGLAQALQHNLIQALSQEHLRAARCVEKEARDEQEKLNGFIAAPSDNYDPFGRKEVFTCCSGFANIKLLSWEQHWVMALQQHVFRACVCAALAN